MYRDAYKEMQRVMKAQNRARQAKKDDTLKSADKEKDYFK